VRLTNPRGYYPALRDDGFGERLRTARRFAGLTTKELARRAGVAEVSVIRWEAGRLPFRMRHVRALADELAVSRYWLMTGDLHP
jgi:transcriptional regulator with XRE-family HTH domain